MPYKTTANLLRELQHMRETTEGKRVHKSWWSRLSAILDELRIRFPDPTLGDLSPKEMDYLCAELSKRLARRLVGRLVEANDAAKREAQGDGPSRCFNCTAELGSSWHKVHGHGFCSSSCIESFRDQVARSRGGE